MNKPLKRGDRVRMTKDARGWFEAGPWPAGTVLDRWRHSFEDPTPMVKVLIDGATIATCWSANAWEEEA